MHEAMESDKFPKASFEIKEVIAKAGDNVILKGVMSMHGVTRAMSFEGSVSEEASKVRLKAKSMMKMSDFGITPPKMVFLTVRDQVDLSVDIVLKR
jgi:polyisoprenoid-binding protein YceI